MSSSHVVLSHGMWRQSCRFDTIRCTPRGYAAGPTQNSGKQTSVHLHCGRPGRLYTWCPVNIGLCAQRNTRQANAGASCDIIFWINACLRFLRASLQVTIGYLARAAVSRRFIRCPIVCQSSSSVYNHPTMRRNIFLSRGEAPPRAILWRHLFRALWVYIFPW